MLETKEQIDNIDHCDVILKNNICFKKENRFTVLHRSVLYDKQLEEIRKAFKDKYSIDYLNMFWIELDQIGHNNYHIDNIDHGEWRDYLIKNNLCIYDQNFVNMTELKKGQGTLTFPDVIDAKTFDQRGAIIGEYKNPFDICMHSNTSNIIWGFAITLKGLASILSVNYETYVQLRVDLQKIEPFLMPFYDYFKEFGSITDTPELKHRLKNHNFDFKI